MPGFFPRCFFSPAWPGWDGAATGYEWVWAQAAGRSRLEGFFNISTMVQERLLVIAHTEQADEIRIITARLATRPEREIYEEDH